MTNGIPHKTDDGGLGRKQSGQVWRSLSRGKGSLGVASRRGTPTGASRGHGDNSIKRDGALPLPRTIRYRALRAYIGRNAVDDDKRPALGENQQANPHPR